MSNSTDTTIPQNNDVLQAIADLSAQINERIDRLEKRFDRLESGINDRFTQADHQFEAIRQGLVANSATFDRLESVVYAARSDVAALKADVKELAEEVRQNQKSLSLK